MRKLAVIGNVDTRCIVYPIARALGLDSLTAVITDDGAYRRLYHGYEDKGTVSGVDVIIGSKVDDALVDLTKESGVPYDTLITVSTNYIPSDVDGVIICHGADRSIIGKTAAEEEAEAEAKAEKERLEAEAQREEAKKNKGKKPVELSEEEKKAQEEKELAEVQLEELKKAQEKADAVPVPDNAKSTEVFISFATSSTKVPFNIILKESALSYVYGCEERKELPVYPDKVYNKTLATMLSKVLEVEANDMFKLLERSEYLAGGKK